MKKLVSILLSSLFFSLAFFCYGVNAASDSLEAVRNIIAGKQHKLVFASIVSVDDYVITVEVTEEIGSPSSNDTDDEIDENIVGEKIEVTGFNSYMYYDNYNHHPKKGDNVLLSLTFSGNVYSVKNGAFKVSSASLDSFAFEVPEDIQNTDGAIELTALYRFVSSDGKNADFKIENSLIITHDPNGEQVTIDEPSGIIYKDAHGKIVQHHNSADSSKSDNPLTDESHRWIIAACLIVAGIVSGFFISKMVIKFEKRSE